jgi:hypothetical protein
MEGLESKEGESDRETPTEDETDRHRRRDRQGNTDTVRQIDRLGVRKMDTEIDIETDTVSYIGIGSSRRHFSSASSVWAAKERRKMAARSRTWWSGDWMGGRDRGE